jgi:hypothetical protein
LRSADGFKRISTCFGFEQAVRDRGGKRWSRGLQRHCNGCWWRNCSQESGAGCKAAAADGDSIVHPWLSERWRDIHAFYGNDKCHDAELRLHGSDRNFRVCSSWDAVFDDDCNAA